MIGAHRSNAARVVTLVFTALVATVLGSVKPAEASQSPVSEGAGTQDTLPLDSVSTDSMSDATADTTSGALAAVASGPVRSGVGGSPARDEEAEDEGGVTGFSLPEAVQIGGQASMSGDFYHSHGTEGRRPGAEWLMTFGSQMTILGAVEMGLDALLSPEQAHAEFQQNINQFGVSPSYKWVQLHLGDFSREYSPHTVQGVRLRGAGVDLTPGDFRFSLQGGRAQRTVSPSDGSSVYKRNVLAAQIGYGPEQGTHLNMTFLTVKDDVSQEERDLVVGDTLLLDTIPVDLRPEIDTRPQENVAIGLDGQLMLLDRMITIRGGVAASLITHDILAEEVELDDDELPISRGVAEALRRFHPIRLSTSFDYAYELESTVNVRGARFRGGYEQVGPGYTSLGLPQMMNDRRGYHVAGTGRVWDDKISLNGQYRHQTNNLLGQRLNTVDRNTTSLSASMRPTERVTTTLSGVVTSMVNDAAVDSTKLDTRSFAMTADAALQQEIFGRASVISLGYNLQRTTDGNPLAQVTSVMTHNVTTSVQFPLTETISLSPSVSGVLTQGDGMDEDQHNLFLGFRGNGRFLDGDLRTSANLTQTINQGRQIFAANAQVSYPLGWNTDVSARARFNRYSAFNQRPGFREALASLSITRSF